MIDVFKYEKRYKYAHMKPADIEIWERFLDKNPGVYESVQYDFNVGDPPPFNPLLDDGTDMNQDALYRLKIDVVAQHKNYIDIIELKPRAGPSSLGQLKSYKILYMRDELPKKPVSMLLITDELMPNMEFLAKNEGIKILVV